MIYKKMFVVERHFVRFCYEYKYNSRKDIVTVREWLSYNKNHFFDGVFIEKFSYSFSEPLIFNSTRFLYLKFLKYIHKNIKYNYNLKFEIENILLENL